MGNVARRGDHLAWQPAGEPDHLLVAQVNAVAVLRLNRPESRNALSQALFTDLVEQVGLLERDPAIRATIIWGGDQVFAAGQTSMKWSMQLRWRCT